MPNIEHNIAKLYQRIGAAAQKSARNPESVLLLAVSKTRSTQEIQTAHQLGLNHFGENYLQDALEKIEQLKDLSIHWHFIGPLQSNKTRAVAENFDWVHTIERLKIAQRLNKQRPESKTALNCCIQVNIDHEASKSGVAPSELEALARQVLELPRLRLRGLMAIPAADNDPGQRTQSFANMATLLQQLRARLEPQFPGISDQLDTLSMGMSADLEEAIIEGASIIRIGTALFGPRNK